MKTVRGKVTGSIFGICTNIAYDDGCCRPGDKSLEVGTVVTSNAETENGICEHYDVQVVAVPRQVTAPQPAPRAVKKEQPITVESIIAKRERPARLPLPKEDAPISQDIIDRAKVPPKIRSNPATMPMPQSFAHVEDTFDGDITGLSPEELAELRGGPSAEPISAGGKPSNPFSSSFDPRTATTEKPRGRW